MIKDLNTGSWNTGSWNTGSWNTGSWNTGDLNTGGRNTGSWNTGSWNTGSWNTGSRNTGGRNTGSWNTGGRNTGSWNTGDLNTGSRNTGSWNTGDLNTGDFNIDTPNTVRVFGIDICREDWDNAYKPDWLYFKLTEWVSESDMSDQEKIDNPTFHTTGGYLKEYEYKEAFKKSYEKASKEDQEAVKNLPNFDADIFFEISGIDLREQQEPTCEGRVVEIDGVKYELKAVK